MIAYGTMQESDAFRNLCRAKGIDFDEINEVAKDLEKASEDPKWKKIIDESKKFIGVICSMSIHPCSNLLFTGNIEEELGIIKAGDEFCTPITSDEADAWKYLKNDYLTVSVWKIIYRVCERIGIPVPSLHELNKLLDDKTWKIYSEGLTCTINQADSDWGTYLCKIYQPRSPAEVAMFTGAIRPNFNPWRDMFVNRQKYSNGVKQLDDLFESTQHFIIFQENLMQFLSWLGIEPDHTIGIIKKISKKKIKQEDFDSMTAGLREHWIKNTGSDYLFDKTWEMVQSQTAYGYNSPHALSVAYDGIYGAYLKSHYPLEYYSVVLDMYSGDHIRTAKLVSEMSTFGISLVNAKFRHSKSEYMPDKEGNKIYKGMKSIKFMSEQISNELYELRNNTYDSFLDLLKDITLKTKLDARQLKILIMLDFFSEFGNSKLLTEINNMFVFFKQGSAKQIAKDAIESPILTSIIQRNAHETSKQFNQLDLDIIMKEYTEYLEATILDDYWYAHKIKFMNEYLGYVDFKTGRPEDRMTLVVLNVKKSVSKKTKKVWAYFCELVSVGTGKKSEVTILSNTYDMFPIQKDDVIKTAPMYLQKKEWNGKVSWYLRAYKKVYEGD